MTASDRAADVAVIGLGSMGLPICVNAASAGLRVQGWNRARKTVISAVETSAQVVDDLSLIDAPIVVSLLPDMPELLTVLKQGLLDRLQAGDLLVVMSTVQPRSVLALSQQLSEFAVSVLDAPVSGGDVGAWQASLSIMAGGSHENFERCRSFFEAIGSRCELMGPMGSGQVAKACNQIIVGATLTAIGEALTLGATYGLEIEQLLNALGAGMAGSRAMEIKREKYLSGRFEPGGKSATQLKDLRIAHLAAAEFGLNLPLTDSVLNLYEEHCESGYGHLDHSSVRLVQTTEHLTGESPD